MIRNIGALLRGKATPTQVLLAGLLGGLIGFVPSLSRSGGLLLVYLLLLLVLNANVGLTFLMASGAKLASLALMPVSFALGRLLLEGPTRGLFEAAVNAPVLAFFGLEYYVTSGGLVLGAVLGLGAGLFLSKTLAGFRNKMVQAEGSERFKNVTGSAWSRCLMWVLVGGGHGRKTYEQLVASGKGGPIRVPGLVLVVLVLATLVFAPNLMSGPMLAGAARGGLESWNGATVDMETLDLDLAAGHLSLSGLALADPNDLGTDLFRAVRLEADLGTEDLLRKKLTIDRLVVVGGQTGSPRSSPGVLVGPAPEPAPEPEADPDSVADGPSKSLDDYLADAELWKQRLAQVREWMDRLSSDDEGGDGRGEEDEESLRDRLEREVAAHGYAAVAARGLVRDAPLLLVREIVADGVSCFQLDGDLLDIRLDNLSSNPSLVEGAARLRIGSQSGRLDVDVGFGGAAAQPTDNVLRFVLNGVATETVAGSLQVDDKPVLSGGTIDFNLDGHWKGGQVGQLDLPLEITLRGVTVDLLSGPRKMDELQLPLGLSGPLDNPRIEFDGKALQDALLAGAKAEIGGRVDEEQAKLEAKKDAKLKEVEDDLADKIGGLFGDDDDDDKPKKKKKKKKKADG